MKIVVIGGSGRIGSRLIKKLSDKGHEALNASPSTGVNTLTGEGLDGVLAGAQAVVDVANSPSFEEKAATDFFETAGKNLLAAEKRAGVAHHLALSVVGTERPLGIGYFRAKLTQEKLIAQSPIPYSIVHATQFFEFVMKIADASSDGANIRLAPVLIQPLASEDVASALAEVATGAPVLGIVEIAGPQQLRLDEFIRQALHAHHDTRTVITDSGAGYYGVEVDERTLLPEDGARLGRIHFAEWLTQFPKSTAGTSPLTSAEPLALSR